MSSISPAYSLETLRLKPSDSFTQTHIRVRIPKSHHSAPVISSLINRYDLKVTILGALLGTNGKEDGWFDLELNGKAGTLCDALLDLVELEADIWFDSEADDGL